MKLYGYWRSSSAYRTRILLNLKGLQYAYVPVDLLKEGGQQNTIEFFEKSPLRQVPVLEVRGPNGSLYLSQSMAIAEYLEEAHPIPSFYPKPTWLRARARELAEMVNAGIQPLQNSRVLMSLRSMGANPEIWCREVISRGFHAIEARLEEVSGEHAVGNSVGLVDAFIVPQIYASRRFDVDLEPFPKIRKVEEACKDLPAFVRAHPDAQPDAPAHER